MTRRNIYKAGQLPDIVHGNSKEKNGLCLSFKNFKFGIFFVIRIDNSSLKFKEILQSWGVSFG